MLQMVAINLQHLGYTSMLWSSIHDLQQWWRKWRLNESLQLQGENGHYNQTREQNSCRWNQSHKKLKEGGHQGCINNRKENDQWEEEKINKLKGIRKIKWEQLAIMWIITVKDLKYATINRLTDNSQETKIGVKKLLTWVPRKGAMWKWR